MTDLAPLLHRESLFLANLALEVVADRGSNVIVGTTLSDYEHARHLVGLLTGYRVDLLVLDCTASQAEESIKARWQNPSLDRDDGNNRFVPSAVIRSQQNADGRSRALEVAQRLVANGLAGTCEIWINRRDPVTGVWETRPDGTIQ